MKKKNICFSKILLIIFGLVIMIYILFRAYIWINITICDIERNNAINDLQQMLSDNDFDADVQISLQNDGLEFVPIIYFTNQQKDVKISIIAETDSLDSVNMKSVIAARNMVADYINNGWKIIFGDKNSIMLDMIICTTSKTLRENYRIGEITGVANRFQIEAKFYSKPYNDNLDYKPTNNLFTVMRVIRGRIKISDMKDFTDATFMSMNVEDISDIAADHDFSVFKDLQYLYINRLERQSQLMDQIQNQLPDECKFDVYDEYMDRIVD